MAEITRREFNKRVAAGLGAAALSGVTGLGRAAPRSPNIVFICSDQHSYKYTGYAGHPIVKTPNLDRIASQGVAFESAYCAHPVCVASRASMMTGVYPSDVNSFCNSTVWDGSHPTWGTLLRQAGYYTRAIGKMDLNDDFDTGFEEIDTSHGHRHNPDITSLFRRPTAYRVGEREGVDGQPRDKRHRDADRTAKAVEFIEKESRGLGRPWALYVGLTEPHPRFVALRKYWEMYPPEGMDLPNIPQGHLEDLHLVYQELRHFKRIATPIPEERVRRARSGYYGMITELDEYVGKIWTALERTGQLENTIFVYTSDHGESLGEHGLWYKNNLYDVAARVPLIVAGPGLPKGKRVTAPVGHVDLVYTLLELANAPRPEALRGTSLLPLIGLKRGEGPRFAYSECHSEGNCTGSFLIRKGDWKYIHFTWYEGLLFNLREDPGELRNRANDPSARDVLIDLQKTLSELVDPEEVTVRAFQRQRQMLEDWGNRMTEQELYERFRGRLGDGQARALAAKVKGR